MPRPPTTPDPSPDSFGATLARLRKRRGLTQVELAEASAGGWTQQQIADAVGISVAQVKKYEKGTSAPTLPFLAKIATSFGVSADEIVFGTANGVAANKLDAELLKRFEVVAQLPERERDAVLIVLDSVIAKHKLREVMG